MKEIIVYDISGKQLNSISQWDRDIYITIRESDITSAYKIHFFNVESPMAYVMESTYADGVLTVKIPNVLVMYPFDIIGYVYKEDASGDGQAVARFRFNILPRPKPSDTMYPGTVDFLSYAEIMENCREYAISEANRVIAENERDLAESNRIEAETKRINAEGQRIANESNRIEAEKIRLDNEALRATAESDRVIAEKARMAAWVNADGMKEIAAVNLDNSDKYSCQLVMSGNHMGIRMTKIEESQ